MQTQHENMGFSSSLGRRTKKDQHGSERKEFASIGVQSNIYAF